MGNSELIDIVDANNVSTGQVLPRGIVHQRQLWHRSAHVWMYSADGRVLLQLRNANKSESSGLWDISAAGHIKSGLSPLEGAVQEAKEELGIDLNPDKLNLFSVYKSSRYVKGLKYQHHQFLYLFSYQLSPSTSLHYSDGEVEDTAWLPIDELAKQLTTAAGRKRLVAHADDYFQLVLKELRAKISSSAA